MIEKDSEIIKLDATCLVRFKPFLFQYFVTEIPLIGSLPYIIALLAGKNILELLFEQNMLLEWSCVLALRVKIINARI